MNQGFTRPLSWVTSLAIHGFVAWLILYKPTFMAGPPSAAAKEKTFVTIEIPRGQKSGKMDGLKKDLVPVKKPKPLKAKKKAPKKIIKKIVRKKPVPKPPQKKSLVSEAELEKKFAAKPVITDEEKGLLLKPTPKVKPLNVEDPKVQSESEKLKQKPIPDLLAMNEPVKPQPKPEPVTEPLDDSDDIEEIADLEDDEDASPALEPERKAPKVPTDDFVDKSPHNSVPLFGSPGSMIDEKRLTAMNGNPKPEYNYIMNRRKMEGFVTLKAYVVNGKVTRVSVHKSSGNSYLDQYAVKTYRQWRYEPGPKGWVLKYFRFNFPKSAAN